jgi:hypothetical protein
MFASCANVGFFPFLAFPAFSRSPFLPCHPRPEMGKELKSSFVTYLSKRLTATSTAVWFWVPQVCVLRKRGVFSILAFPAFSRSPFLPCHPRPDMGKELKSSFVAYL